MDAAILDGHELYRECALLRQLEYRQCDRSRLENLIGQQFRFLVLPTVTAVAEYRFGYIDYFSNSGLNSYKRRRQGKLSRHRAHPCTPGRPGRFLDGSHLSPACLANESAPCDGHRVGQGCEKAPVSDRHSAGDAGVHEVRPPPPPLPPLEPPPPPKRPAPPPPPPNWLRLHTTLADPAPPVPAEPLPAGSPPAPPAVAVPGCPPGPDADVPFPAFPESPPRPLAPPAPARAAIASGVPVAEFPRRTTDSPPPPPPAALVPQPPFPPSPGIPEGFTPPWPG